MEARWIPYQYRKYQNGAAGSSVFSNEMEALFSPLKKATENVFR